MTLAGTGHVPRLPASGSSSFLCNFPQELQYDLQIKGLGSNTKSRTQFNFNLTEILRELLRTFEIHFSIMQNKDAMIYQGLSYGIFEDKFKYITPLNVILNVNENEFQC